MDTHRVYLAIGVVLLGALAFAAWYLLRDRSALRDVSSGTNRPYSLSRVQLWWWSTIIIATTIVVFMFTGEPPSLNATCLELLGVSLGTTVSGRIIDNTDQAKTTLERHQNAESKGFFSDILSDKDGISVHRFQCVAFNVIYGLTFVVYVLEQLEKNSKAAEIFPDFPATTMGILVASASAYLVVKTSENIKRQ